MISEEDGGRGGDITLALSEALTVSLEKEIAFDRTGGGLLIWLGVSGMAISAGGSSEV